LLPGAGVIYAGKVAIGMSYLVVVFVLLFAAPPLAIAVWLVSYGHAVMAVMNWNQEIEESERSTKPLIPPPSAFQSKVTTTPQIQLTGKSCSICGGEVSETARYCKTCGEPLDQTQVW
jgi:hypothetical protein